MDRPWQREWSAYKAAQAEYEAAIEAFKSAAPGDERGLAVVLWTAQRLRDAWSAFGQAFDKDQFGD
jgi:hypothetical protein